jgi:hypothetical protein
LARFRFSSDAEASAASAETTRLAALAYAVERLEIGANEEPERLARHAGDGEAVETEGSRPRSGPWAQRTAPERDRAVKAFLQAVGAAA